MGLFWGQCSERVGEGTPGPLKAVSAQAPGAGPVDPAVSRRPSCPLPGTGRQHPHRRGPAVCPRLGKFTP